MRVSYDQKIDAAYLYFTDEPLMSGRDTVGCDAPEGVSALMVMG